MNLNEAIDKLNDLKTQTREVEKLFLSNEELFKTQYANILAGMMKESGIGRIVVKAYTPYFNDGDPCRYGIKSVEAYESINPESDDDGGDMDWDTYRNVENYIDETTRVFEILFDEGKFVFRSDGSFEEDECCDHY